MDAICPNFTNMPPQSSRKQATRAAVSGVSKAALEARRRPASPCRRAIRVTSTSRPPMVAPVRRRVRSFGRRPDGRRRSTTSRAMLSTIVAIRPNANVRTRNSVLPKSVLRCRTAAAGDQPHQRPQYPGHHGTEEAPRDAEDATGHDPDTEDEQDREQPLARRQIDLEVHESQAR